MPFRGEVWWAFRENRSAMVILSTGGEGDLLAIYVVPSADQDITGVAVELPIGAEEGLPSGVVRVALPGPGRIPCSWLVSLKKDDLIEQAGTLPEEKLASLARCFTSGGWSADGDLILVCWLSGFSAGCDRSEVAPSLADRRR